MSHHPRRRFGQNFLSDPGVIDQMLAAIQPQAGQSFLEIGPGQGALTKPLLEAGVHLHAIEIDRDLAGHLASWPQARSQQLRITVDDALKHPIANLTQLDPASPLRIVGNLPYNLSTPLLFHLTNQLTGVTDLHLLLQREVVERMAAQPGNGTYGRLSVMLQYRCQVIPVLAVPPEAFRPAPQVHSSFVRLLPLKNPPLPNVDPQALAAVVKQAFGQRRKTLRNALGGLLTAADIAASGIDPTTRAEQVDLVGFGQLAITYQQMTNP